MSPLPGYCTDPCVFYPKEPSNQTKKQRNHGHGAQPRSTYNCTNGSHIDDRLNQIKTTCLNSEDHCNVPDKHKQMQEHHNVPVKHTAMFWEHCNVLANTHRFTKACNGLQQHHSRQETYCLLTTDKLKPLCNIHNKHFPFLFLKTWLNVPQQMLQCSPGTYTMF